MSEKQKTYVYGIMSSKFELTATNKLTAYATMSLQLKNNINMIAIYAPETNKADAWINLDGTTHEKLDKLFGGNGEFENYLINNQDDIKACLNSIKSVI